ncbi:undecaprenyl-diphosphate phosphatase, partial [Thioclava sp. BHET1]
LYFWRDWTGILAALFGRGEPLAVAAGRRLLVLLVLGTLPAVILGGLLEHPLRRLFGSPEFVAGILAVNGIVLFTAEKLRRRATGQQGLESLRIRQVLIVGVAQAGALIPGFSRSGLTIGAGLGLGLSHGQSARLSFLLALPIILGASALEIPKLLHHHPATTAAAQSGHPIGLGVSLLAGLVAGLTAYASTAFLMRLFRKPEFEALNPFALYCLLAGLGALALLASGPV